ncbi:MAG: substrate-binding domain-containing protein, partial [Cyanobacteria bacterium P01_H01_bin.121]
MTDSIVSEQNRIYMSAVILVAALGLAYAPIPGLNQTITVVSGSELQEPLTELEAIFEERHGDIEVKIEIQGSQDMVDRYLTASNDFEPTVLIPANAESLNNLEAGWQLQNQDDRPLFHERPRPITRTMLVGIAWPERGQILFPDGRFDWENVQTAIEADSWADLGGNDRWGRFDFLMTDPTRSNSGQLTLDLWTQAEVGSFS